MGAETDAPQTAAIEWPEYVTPCLLLLDLLAKPSNIAKLAELEQGAATKDRAGQHQAQRHTQRQSAASASASASRSPEPRGGGGSSAWLLPMSPALPWPRDGESSRSDGTGARHSYVQ